MKNKEVIGPIINNCEAFILANYFKTNNETILYIGKDDREISNIYNRLKWLLPKNEVYLYKSWDQIPYDRVSPSKEIQLQRINTLYSININKKKFIILATINSVIQKTIPKDIILENSFYIQEGLEINFDIIVKKLIKLGYERTSIVRDKSEFAIRGSILDIYLTNLRNPIRLDFYNNTIESIYEFDPISQKRLKKFNKEKVLVHLCNELTLNSTNVKLFRKNFRQIFINYRNSEFYNLFSEMILPSGGEQFLPLFYLKLNNLFDYLENFRIFLSNEFDQILENRIENLNDFYNSRNSLNDNFYLKPEYLFLKKDELYKNLDKNKFYQFSLFNNNKLDINFIHNLSSLRKEIDFRFIKKFFEKKSQLNNVIVCCRSHGNLLRTNKIFKENLGLAFEIIDTNNDIVESNNLYITVLDLEDSFQYKKNIYINEKTIFGYAFNIKKRKDFKNTEFLFEELNKLTRGNILVHAEYGICKFNDTKKIYLDDAYHECLELEFYDNQKLYLPIENLNHITKYSNDENNNIILDKLGSSHWQKRKAEAKNKIRDAAKKLIRIASLRLKSRSYDIDIKNNEYDKFCSTFPYIETDDQLSAINDILDDFTKKIPSDRLIVGDVAFGKTEVIMRAAFLAAKSKIQTIILVPTTLLSRQHFDNFTNRLKIFDINISEISRLVSSKEKLKTFEKCKNGEIDILIGTHALLNDKLNFNKLGLIIYDEEQKLGTLQKEKFKEIAPRAHVISLSATPIPRTLSMAISGVRDLSLILTAPFERLAVRTYVTPFDEFTIIEAIKREIIGRKNGVYFVTPRKKDIPFIEKFLKEKLPEIKYVVTHGQLSPKILEEKISKFYSKEIPLMISTNIIENGLDLPHVNTIIIYRSNIFSLSSLYQLRGRVGRSSTRGYAYITYKENELKDNGRKRLSIINSASQLGSGFNIASQDLDLRGGGSIIGEEQSGFIREIGTELYYQMLEEELEYQKNKILDKKTFSKSEFQPNIKIPEEIFIPENYIDDMDLRLSIYKRISNLKNHKEINNLLIELTDRFGELPIEVNNLFKLIELRILCVEANIDKLEFNRKGIVIGFYKNIPKNPKKLLDSSLREKNNLQLRPDQKLFYDFNGFLEKNRFKLAKEIIKSL